MCVCVFCVRWLAGCKSAPLMVCKFACGFPYRYLAPGRSVGRSDTIEELLSDTSTVEQLPTFDVFELDCRLYTINNRRLFIWRLLAVKGFLATRGTFLARLRADDPLRPTIPAMTAARYNDACVA